MEQRGRYPQIAIICDRDTQSLPQVELRQLALIFEKFAFLRFGDREFADPTGELAFLSNNSMIVDDELLSDITDNAKTIFLSGEWGASRELYFSKAGIRPKRKFTTAEEAHKIFRVNRFVISQVVCNQLREKFQLEPTPVFADGFLPFSPDHDPLKNRAEVLGVLINSFPMPDVNTPWEAIIEFNNDTSTSGMKLRFLRWARSLVETQRRPQEVLEEVEYLIHEYETYMKLQRMKTTRTTFETLIVTTAEILEDLTKFKWGKLANGLFTARRQRVVLGEAEQSAPGREIALITEARKRFSQS